MAADRPDPDLPAAGSPDAGAPQPLSATQERFWFLDGLREGVAADILQRVYRLGGPLDTSALDRALTAVVTRHEVLRSQFVDDGERVGMQVLPAGRAVLRPVDLTREAFPADRALDLVRLDAFQPFTLTRGPLFRAQLLVLGREEHLLTLTAHRSVFDEPSFTIVEADLARAYTGALAGPVPARPALSFARHAGRERERADEDAVAVWRDRLAGAPEAIELPVDRARPLVPSYRAGEVTFTLLPETVRRLGAGPVPAGAMVLSAFAVTLGVYARAVDVVVGLTVDGRDEPGTDDLVGPLAGHVPIRVDLAGPRTPAELFDRVSAALHDWTLDGTSFDRIAREFDREHDISRHPVFQFGFSYGPARGTPAWDGLSVHRTPVTAHWSRVDLELNLVHGPDGTVTGQVLYATDLFGRETVEGFTDTYRVVLDRLVADPGQPLGAVDLLTPGDRILLFEEWNTTDPSMRTDRTMAELFTEQAHRTPDDIAVRMGPRSLTYAELNGRSNRLAAYLVSLGVGPEDIVGLCVRRGPDLMVAVLAIMKSGGTYLPLDPGSPSARNEFLLTDTGARLVLTESALVPLLPPRDDVTYLAWDRHTAEIEAFPADDAPPRATADNPIYIIHTSGSSGVPKGVVMTHRPLSNMLRWQLRRATVSGPTLQFTSIGFDVSFQEMFATWLAGGVLVLLADDDRRDPQRLWEVLSAEGVRRLYCPPMVLEQLAHVRSDRPLVLREIITAGETLRITPEIRRFLGALGEVTLDNQFGPTEAHAISGHRMTGPVRDWPALPPVGRAVPNVRVLLLDEHRRPVPVGAPGEVYIGGVAPARGYLDRPELTAERFVVDPFGSDPRARMYRTGDLARWRADGVLLFLGRADDQVKIRGYRVEPGEVEAALVAHDTVAEAAVLPVELAGDRRLAAYIVTAPGAVTPSAGELRAALRERLPEYMIPTYVVPVDRLPLTPVGKIDRKALPDPTVPTRTAAPSEAVAASLQDRLLDIWREVIGVPDIEAHDDFFDVGGHSLLAAKVTGRIKETLGIDLPIRAIFANTTVAQLAAAVAEGVDGDGTVAAAKISAVTVHAGREVAPATAFQRGTWLLHQIYPGCVAYHMPMLFQVDGPVDAAALDRALTMLVARHQAFRTSFAPADGAYAVQRVHPPSEAVFTEVDLTNLPADRRAGAARAHAEEVIGDPLDLTSAPLWRAVRYRLGDDRALLLFVMHHLVTDGWSMEIIKAELAQAYRAALRDEPPGWPGHPVQPGDLADWEAEPESIARMARELRFWRERIDVTAAPLRLPTARRRTGRGFAGEAVRGALGPALTAAVRRLSATAGASPFSVMLSAFAVVLGRYSGQDHFNVGTPLIVRDQPALEETVGFLTNTMVIGCDVGPGTFTEVVGRTQDAVVNALANPHLPFEVLVADLGPPRDPHGHPLFDVWFNMLTFPRRDLVLDGAQVSELRPPLAGALFDLAAYVHDNGADMDIELVYRPDLFTRDRIEVLHDHLRTVLERACADPLAPVADVAPAAAHRPPATFEPPVRTGLAERVAAHTATRPGHPAVAHTDGLSYAELWRGATGLAARLARAGAVPGRVVAVAARRHPDLLTAMLAVRAAGSAFCLLDLDFPGRRLADHLARVEAAVLVAADPERIPDELRAVTTARGTPVVAVHVAAPPDGGTAAAGVPGPAYVAFTSGTTGRPMGIVAPETPTTVFFEWYSRRFELTAADRFSVLSGLSHDPLLRETLLPLWLGATACVPDGPASATPTATVDWLAGQRCTVVHLTPPRSRVLVAAAQPAGRTLPSVRLVSLGGAAVDGADHHGLRQLFPNARLVSLYGATETPQGVSIVDLAAEFPDGDPYRHPPLGAGSPSAELLVVGPDGHDLPVNAVGEVVVRSPYLASGYLGPSAPACGFGPDPAGDPEIRRYRTGDLGRYRPDGSVEYLGRLDEQISLDASRIEPAEVDNAAREHAGVAESAVIVHDERIVLAVRVTEPLDLDDLRRHLGDRLPPAAMPDTILPVRFPLTTPNGKVDRDRISAETARLRERTTAGSGGTVLTTVVDIMRDVLDVPDVDVDATFFAGGATSLALLRMHLHLRDTIDHSLELADLFEFQTPRRLATRLAGDPSGPAGRTPPAAGTLRGRLGELRQTRQQARVAAMTPD